MSHLSASEHLPQFGRVWMSFPPPFGWGGRAANGTALAPVPWGYVSLEPKIPSDLVSHVLSFRLWSLVKCFWSPVAVRAATGGSGWKEDFHPCVPTPALSPKLPSLLISLFFHPLLHLVAFQPFCTTRKSKDLAAFYSRLFYLKNLFGLISQRNLISPVTGLFKENPNRVQKVAATGSLLCAGQVLT